MEMIDSHLHLTGARFAVAAMIPLVFGMIAHEAGAQNGAQQSVQQLLQKPGLETEDLKLLHQYYRASTSKQKSKMGQAFAGKPFRVTGKVAQLLDTNTGVTKVTVVYEEEVADNLISGIQLYYDCETNRIAGLKIGDALTVVSRLDSMQSTETGNERRKYRNLAIRVTKSPVKMMRPDGEAGNGERNRKR